MYYNLMLSGQLRSQVCLRIRSVFAPKKNGRPRPLGIGDSWYLRRTNSPLQGRQTGGPRSLSPVQLGIDVKNGAEIGGQMPQLVFNFGEI